MARLPQLHAGNGKPSVPNGGTIEIAE